MEKSFHYYATYSAAYLAGFSHEQSREICYSAQLVDHCSRTYLERIGGPLAAATTQLAGEMAQARTDPAGLADITRIWASFHFLPRDLQASVPRGGKRYRNKYRLICGPNGKLLVDTIGLAQGKGTQAIGIAMHVLADTWAHRNFAGTPSLVINNTNRCFVELLPTKEGSYEERPVRFRHSAGTPDDIDAGIYTNSVYQASENSIMNLGHGRAGHLPDYSFIQYRYAPAWGDYEETLKDNPTEYYQAFCQMVYALGYLRNPQGPFELHTYDTDAVANHQPTIMQILKTRQLDAGACKDWKAFAESLSGQSIPDFEIDAHIAEYQGASPEYKNETFLGRFILAALAQKGMVTNRIYASGNPIAGRTIEYDGQGRVGIRDFMVLVDYLKRGD